MLDKPVPVATLSACVQDALAEAAVQGRPAAAPAPTPRTPIQDTPTGGACQAAIATHFAGQAALFDRFRAASLLQFPADIAEGDSALARGDTAALHRLAHSLKTVLQLLGDDGSCALARRLESAAAAGGAPATVAALWDDLRQAVQAQG